MKKLLFSLLVVSGSATVFTSCNKIVDEIKKNINAFNYTAPEVTYDLPAIAEGQEYKSEDQTYDLNINQIIDENVGDDLNVTLDDISKISINKITLHMENGDDDNNWTNFESATVKANTDKGKSEGKADLTATTSIEDIESERYTDKVITFADHNLKDYVNGEGTKVTYSISAKARRAVTKQVKIIATIQYSFKP